MKQIIFTLKFLFIFGKLYSQNIVGKWSMIECENREFNNKIPVVNKSDRIILTLNSDNSYIKVFYQYNPFDKFRTELPEINTLTDKMKKIPNKKMKVKGTYSYDGRETLSLVRDNKTIEYRIYFDRSKLVIINEIIEPDRDIMTIYQRFEKIK